jgi:hypothetical protein
MADTCTPEWTPKSTKCLAAGMTVPASAFAQTERPTNPPDKPRGQVIAALSQEPTDRR